MPLGIGIGNKTFDERLRENQIRNMASAQGKTVKDFLEDRDYQQEIAAIESEEQTDAELDAEQFNQANGLHPCAC